MADSSYELLDICDFVHDVFSETSRYDVLLKDADRALRLFTQATSKTELDKRVLNELISNARLLDQVWQKLFSDLEGACQYLDKDRGKYAKQQIDVLKNRLQSLMPQFRQQDKSSDKWAELPRMLPSLRWMGQQFLFHTKADLGKQIQAICDELIKTSNPTVRFEIHLPQPSQQEMEQDKSRPHSRIHDYARVIFEHAARAGYPPSDVIIEINGEKISHAHDVFKGELTGWEQTSNATVQRKMKSNLLEPQTDEDDSADATHSAVGFKRS